MNLGYVARTKFTIDRRCIEFLKRESLGAQQSAQKEVCGILLCDAKGKLFLEYLDNLAVNSGRFEISRKEILRVARSKRPVGLRLVGLFHSHPISEAIPGPSDIDGTPVGFLQLIYDVCARECRLWRIVRTKNEGKIAGELELEVTVANNIS